jgi:hypothetical protein
VVQFLLLWFSTAFFKLEADSRDPTGPIHLLPQGVTFTAWVLDFKSSLLHSKDTRISDG